MPRALYLLRHEEAEPAASGPDGHRTLTPHGRARMHRTGRRFAQLGEPIDLILTSPLVRAVQTAEILATNLAFEGPLYSRLRIAEPSSFADLDAVIAEAGAHNVVVVGHEPTLSSYTGHLLGQALPRGYSPGTMYALSLGAGRAAFRWVLWPDAAGPSGSLT